MASENESFWKLLAEYRHDKQREEQAENKMLWAHIITLLHAIRGSDGSTVPILKAEEEVTVALKAYLESRGAGR